MAKNGHRKERRSVTHLLAMDKRRRKAKGPIKQLTAADMQKDYEQLTAQFSELGKLWKIYKVYFDIVSAIDPSKKENEEFTTNNQICIDEDSKVDVTVNALKEKSFNVNDTKDDMATFESTIGVFDILQESILVMNDTYVKLTNINKYCKSFYPEYRSKLYEVTDIYGKVFDRMFDFKSDELTVEIDMSKEEDTSNKPSGLVKIPTDTDTSETSFTRTSGLVKIPDELRRTDPVEYIAVENDKSELTSSYNLDTETVIEKEFTDGEESERTERKED